MFNTRVHKCLPVLHLARRGDVNLPPEDGAVIACEVSGYEANINEWVDVAVEETTVHSPVCLYKVDRTYLGQLTNQ